MLLLGVCGPVGLVYSSIIHPLMLSHGIQRCFSNFSSYPRTKLKAKNNTLISFFLGLLLKKYIFQTCSSPRKPCGCIFVDFKKSFVTLLLLLLHLSVQSKIVAFRPNPRRKRNKSLIQRCLKS